VIFTFQGLRSPHLDGGPRRPGAGGYELPLHGADVDASVVEAAEHDESTSVPLLANGSKSDLAAGQALADRVSLDARRVVGEVVEDLEERPLTRGDEDGRSGQASSRVGRVGPASESHHRFRAGRCRHEDLRSAHSSSDRRFEPGEEFGRPRGEKSALAGRCRRRRGRGVGGPAPGAQAEHSDRGERGDDTGSAGAVSAPLALRLIPPCRHADPSVLLAVDASGAAIPTRRRSRARDQLLLTLPTEQP
jgi:hypothetical protein